jgi:hypothetical protein
MTAQSRADARQSPDRAALLAIEAYRRHPTLEAAAGVQSVLASQPQGLIARLGEGSKRIPHLAYGRSLIVAREGPICRCGMQRHSTACARSTMTAAIRTRCR